MMDAFWLALSVKMLASACVVVFASIVVERSGPFIGAMVATLPISAGPAYAFLAIEHGPAFIERSTVASLAMNGIMAAFLSTYSVLAQKRSLLISLAAALALWLVAAALVSQTGWTLLTAAALNLAIYPLCMVFVRQSIRTAPPAQDLSRQWWEVPARALGVMSLVGIVILSGRLFGPAVAGVAAVAPVVMTSLAVVLHRKAGGAVAASVLANSLPGMVGTGLALVAVNLVVISHGPAAALLAGLMVCVGWNLALIFLRARLRAA